MELQAVDPPIILIDALQELSIQLSGLEKAVTYHDTNLFPLITSYQEQINDFKYLISTLQVNNEQVNSGLVAHPKVEQALLKSGNQAIIIKVSNHHYVPKVLHPQTIVTYMTESK